MIITRIPLHHIHQNLNAKIVEFGGFEMPVRYSSDIEEHLAVRQNVGIFDVSHMGEFIISGKESSNFLQFITSNNINKLFPGRVQYSFLPNENGGVIDDLLIYNLNENEYFLVVNASNIEKDFAWIQSQILNFDCKLENVSNQYCLFALQGPKAIELLQNLTSIDLKNIEYYHFQIGEIDGSKDIIISNTGYTGAGGFEIYVKNEEAEKIWNKIFEIGKQYNLKPIGLGARDTLRLEMGFCLYGNELNDNTSPLEAGLGWVTYFDKDFVGKEEILKIKNQGLTKKLVAIKMLERGIPRSHYKIFDSSNIEIGHITSGTQSPLLNYGIALGYVSINDSRVGNNIFIEIRNQKVKAEIVKLPFINK